MSKENKSNTGFRNSRNTAQLHRAWKKEYFEMLRKELDRLKGEDVDITYRDVRKNNGVYRKACTVRFHDAQVAPTVYLDPYYDHYLHGEAVSESAENILKYSHIEFEDMSAVFFYLLEDPSFGNGMIIVRNTDMERWQKAPGELMEQALRNCASMLPPVFRSLADVLDVFRPADEGNLYLLTNESALYGAAVLLYPGILQEIAEYLGGGFFVLPSSVHEVILLPDHGEEAGDLLEIVTEINHTQVAEEEILTDAVYKYEPGDAFIRRMA